jgi:hypothetical protein
MGDTTYSQHAFEAQFKGTPASARVCSNCYRSNATTVAEMPMGETALTPGFVIVCNASCGDAMARNCAAAVRLNDGGNASCTVDSVCESLNAIQMSINSSAAAAGTASSDTASVALSINSAQPTFVAASAFDSMPPLKKIEASEGANSAAARGRYDGLQRLGVVTLDGQKTHQHSMIGQSILGLAKSFPNALGGLYRTALAAAEIDEAMNRVLKQQFALYGTVVLVSADEARTGASALENPVEWVKARLATLPLLRYKYMMMTANATTNKPIVLSGADPKTAFGLRVHDGVDPGAVSTSTAQSVQSAKAFENKWKGALMVRFGPPTNGTVGSPAGQWYLVSDLYIGSAGFVLVYNVNETLVA